MASLRGGSKRVADGPSDHASPKRQRTSDALGPEVVQSRNVDDPVAFWALNSQWPPKYCDPSPMERMLARKKSALSAPSSSIPSDQKPREEKSAPYMNPQYELVLNTKDVYLKRSELGIADASKNLCRNLLKHSHSVPKDTIFDDDIFEHVCENLQWKNEARVILDISRLIVPSAETFALRNKSFKYLTESVNEGWNNSVPLTSTRPQPDYSVGFEHGAFTKAQHEKMSPIVGDWADGDQSFFLATYYMYFPFLTCECSAALDVADRQNAHSMTLAVRAIVELFRLVGRESEVHREILAFSISHDEQSVRIYGHYPVIDGKDTKYYRHPIHDFYFTALDGKEKWTAYQFTKNVYDTWVPGHLNKIREAIDQLPSMDFDVPVLSEPTGLSQGLENLARPGVDSARVDEEVDQSQIAGQVGSPDTSVSRPELANKKRRENPTEE
ncbi:hypothetical protein V8C35DRAFT_290173 [Trichoderma chlorosporum]